MPLFNTEIKFEEVTENQFGKIPDGKYLVFLNRITKMIWASSDQGKSIKIDITDDPAPETADAFLECQYQIVEGEFAGKTYFNSLHMWAENDTRRNIARMLFKKICLAVDADPKTCGVDKLINRPFYITIKTSKDGKYTNISNVDKYSSIEYKNKINNSNNDDIMF